MNRAQAAARPVHALSGALSFETVPELYRRSGEWFAGSEALTVDLAAVTRADSAGLALLIEWLRRARVAGRPLHFTRIPPQVQTLIRVSGLEKILTDRPET